MPQNQKDALGDAIDQFLTVDMDQRGVINGLYDAAYEYHGRSPTMLAAESLVEEVSEGDEVFIATGFPIAPTYVQETDGPIGAVSLARAVQQGLGAHPTIFAEEQAVPTIEAAAKAFGLNINRFTSDLEARKADWTCSVEAFSTDPDTAETEAAELLESRDPTALLAVERCGANHLGEYHMMTGVNITDDAAKTEPLFEQADALTIGVGDGGNEIGMGVIRNYVEEEVPYGANCECGCGGGITAETETDVLVPATISNHGGHGIAAALSVLLDETVLHPPEIEKRGLIENGLAGAIDGPSGRADGWSDGLSPSAHASVIEVLHAIIADSSY